MKEIQDVIQDSLKIMFLGILMYIVSFWFIPLGYFLFGIWVVDLEGFLIFISWISQGIIAVAGIKKVKNWKIIFYWLMGDLLYCCLIAFIIFRDYMELESEDLYLVQKIHTKQICLN